MLDGHLTLLETGEFEVRLGDCLCACGSSRFLFVALRAARAADAAVGRGVRRGAGVSGKKNI